MIISLFPLEIVLFMNKIPVTIVTGFLGSGKTTLLRKLLASLRNRKLALIVNEFGAVDIDGQLLRSAICADENCREDRDDMIYELSNGCICCTVQDEFHPVLRRLSERVPLPEQVFIETSGLALPKPLVQAFNWPDIKPWYTVDAVISVLDAAALAKGDFTLDAEAAAAAESRTGAAANQRQHDPSVVELFDDQLLLADIAVLNKCDLVPAKELDALESSLRARLHPSVKIMRSVEGELPSIALVGLDLCCEQGVDDIHSHHDAHHEEGHEHRHAHEDFQQAVLELGEVEHEKLARNLAEIGPSTLRIKGFAAVAGKKMRLVVQSVGSRLSLYYDRLWQPGEERETRLVVIGRDLNVDMLKARLSS